MTQAIRIAADDTLSPLRALNSLTPAQADQIVAGLSSLATAWTIARHESCDGQLTLLVAHAAHDTTLVVHRDSTGITVSLMNGDEIRSLDGRHDSTASVVHALKDLAGRTVDPAQRHSA